MAACERTVDRTSEINIPRLFLGHKHVIGSTMGTQPDLETLVGLTADGAVNPTIGNEYTVGQKYANIRR